MRKPGKKGIQEYFYKNAGKLENHFSFTDDVGICQSHMMIMAPMCWLARASG
jgi:hypothetical protein